MATLSSNIYNIAQIVEDIKATYIEENEDTLASSTFGYLGAIAIDSLRDVVNSINKLANEAIYSRATLPKNIITYAIQKGVDGITAIPSIMKVRIAFVQEDLLKLMGDSNVLVLDKDWKIYIGDFEFHLDYNLKITKTKISGNKYIFSAFYYDIDKNNPLSDVVNPYLDPPNTLILDRGTVIVFTVNLRQVTHEIINKKFISNNLIENKTFTFEFEDQLASFDIRIAGTDTYIKPVFQGEATPTDGTLYCNYSYLDTNKIRIKFDKDSYIPTLNTEIEVLLKTTKGSKGIFPYNTNAEIIVTSDIYDYNNLSALIMPVTDSNGGTDRLSIKELQTQLPIVSAIKGNIGNQKDLETYLQNFADSESRLNCRKKADNQFERSYYTYLLMKDKNNNIIPTNTIDLVIDVNDFNNINEKGNDIRYTLKQGCYILHNIGDSHARVVPTPSEEELSKADFIYTSPFMISIYKNLLQSSFYLSILDENYIINYDYINEDSNLQFIATNITWKRSYLDDPSKYKLNLQLTQNISTDMGALEEVKDESGSSTVVCNMKVIMVIYEEGTPYRYMIGDLISYDLSNYSFNYEIDFESSDIINQDNYIRIENTYIPKQNGIMDYGYFNPNPEVRIYVAYKSDIDYGRFDLDNIVAGLEGYVVSNVYSIDGGIEFFRNYSEILSCNITPTTITDEEGNISNAYFLRDIPVIKRSYMNDENKISNFINTLNLKKSYVENAIRLMDGFSVDFKFINTYGQSRLYYLPDGKPLDKVNLTLHFEVELLDNIDKNIITYIKDDIKTLIEDLDDISTMHAITICTTIRDKYSNSILYIDFKGYNNYQESYKKLTLKDDENITPEFLNVDVSEEDETQPMIIIEVV